MDPFDTTNILFSKIKSLDPENASKIMGYLLIQDIGERDMMRLAYGQESLLNSLIIKIKTHLGLSSNTLSVPLNPISRPIIQNSHNPFSQSSPRIENNGFLDSPTSNTWSLSGSPNSNKNTNFSPKSSPFLSYDNIRAGSLLVPVNGSSGGGGDCSNGGDFIDEFQLNEYLSFLNDSSSKNEEFMDPRLQLSGYSVNNGDTHLHKRSFSASDACFGSEDAGCGIGYRPCHYYARGYCKNGDNCKFVHGGFGDSVDVNGGVVVGSPNKMEGLYLQHEEMMRMKAAQQQRLAVQLMGGGSPLAYNKTMNLLLQQQNDLQRSAAAELMMEDFYKFGRCRPERNDILAMGLADKANSAARQIYLTFPAESSFTDEDVSNYFGMFGPVQDVRIPYQQKRMFGFVTFVLPETVKLIFARGNPHFICDSRVLVKPYKEKGKVSDKRQQHLQQQQLEIGNASPCSSPSGLDCREPYDLHLGAKMFYNTPEMMFRRRFEEQADLQQAIELQRRRFMNLQLPNLKNDGIHHHQRSLSVGSPVSLPTHTHINQDVILSPDGIDQKVIEVNTDTSAATIPSTAGAAAEQQLQQDVTAVCTQNNDSDNSKEMSSKPEGFDHVERAEGSVDQSLPDSLFASPTKSAENHLSDLSLSAKVNESIAFSAISSSENNAVLPITAPGSMSSH